ncbi:Developmentally-regulated GTP-binding protein 2 [Quaeritorhiza haematococci]|nr:Developmentally-regulated GTP-binding protein 2 [Quaeritorhiza haematococci]
MGILEKIADIEREINRTQKNKATEHHLGLLKAKLAKYRVMLLEPQSKGGPKGAGFDVVRSGDARVALIGFPSVGKSTFLSKATGTKSEAAAYEFTTLTCIPGKIHYNGADIQLLDLPGIIEGAAQGKGRGRQVIAVAKTADLILMMLDATKGPRQRELLEAELEAVGIRINRRRPNIYFKVKKGGGISFNATCKLSYLNERLVYQILQGYKIHNAEVLVREDATVDEFIDVVLGNRKYIRCLYCYNKIDQISIEEVDKLARQPNTVVVSCEQDLNMDLVIGEIWKALSLVRVYTKRKGEFPDFDGGLILKSHTTVEGVCHAIHRTLVEEFNYALVWGTSTKHSPQRVGLSHVVEDEDVIQVVKKK